MDVTRRLKKWNGQEYSKCIQDSDRRIAAQTGDTRNFYSVPATHKKQWLPVGRLSLLHFIQLPLSPVRELCEPWLHNEMLPGEKLEA